MTRERIGITGHLLVNEKINREQIFIQWLMERLAKDIRVEGSENIPEDGYTMFIINHMGWQDPLFVHLALRELHGITPYFLTKKETLKNLKFLLIFFPDLKKHLSIIDRDNPTPNQIRNAKNILTQGGYLLVAPEGTRGHNQPYLKEAYRGATYIAKTAAYDLKQQDNSNSIKIVPCAIQGTDEGIARIEELDIVRLATQFRNLVKRPEIRLTFGQPFVILPPTERRFIREGNADQTKVLMLTLRDMLPNKYHSIYASRPSPNYIIRNGMRVL